MTDGVTVFSRSPGFRQRWPAEPLLCRKPPCEGMYDCKTYAGSAATLNNALLRDLTPLPARAARLAPPAYLAQPATAPRRTQTLRLEISRFRPSYRYLSCTMKESRYSRPTAGTSTWLNDATNPGRALPMEASNKPVRYNGDDSGSKTLKVVVALMVLAVIGGVVAWVLVDRSGNGSATAPTPTTTTSLTSKIGPLVAKADVLSALAANVDHTVYWAGPIAGQRYEFLEAADGSVYIRYLPKGVAVGDKRANWLVVATYPFAKAHEALQNVAKGKGITIPGGGIAVVTEGRPQSIHFAFPGVAYQGEIYDPSAKKALAVATSGDIKPVP